MFKFVASRFAIPLFAILVLSTVGYGQDDQETSLTAQADRCRKLLKESLIDFYLPASMDKENGLSLIHI